METLLKLYSRVNNKTLKISKTLGIEGGKLLKETDQYDDLKNFTEKYNGKLTPIEKMHLELQQLLKANSELETKLNQLPGRVFSGKSHPAPDSQSIFFCYARPAKDTEAEQSNAEEIWTLEAGDVQWYLYDLTSKDILDDPATIIETIRSDKKTKRHCNMSHETLSSIRQQIDKHIKNTYLKSVQAPIDAPKPKLIAWMELN